MLPDFITNKSILTPLSLIITSLSNFAFMLILVSGVVFAFYKTNLHDGLMKITPYGKMSLTNYITQKYSRFHVILQLGICIAQSVWYHSQLPGRNSFLHLAILFLPLVDESPLSRPDGIYMETGNLAEISQNRSLPAFVYKRHTNRTLKYARRNHKTIRPISVKKKHYPK